MKQWCMTCLFLCLAVSAQARVLSIDIWGAGQKTVHLYIAPPLFDTEQKQTADSATIFQNTLRHLLSHLAFLDLVSPAQIVGGEKLRGPGADQIDFKRFSLSKVDLLISSFWNPGQDKNEFVRVEVRAFDVLSGSFILGKAYTVYAEEQIQEIAGRFSAALMKYLTGSGAFFESEIVYVQKKGRIKEIATVTPQGTNFRQRTSLNGLCLSPAWSQDGQKIVFAYIDGKEHRLGVWERGAAEVKTWSMPGNSCISPVFDPYGKVVVSLDSGGTPNIYLLGDNLQVEKPLVTSWAIDITPSFDKSGQKMTFVSNRQGNPHVFLFEIDSGKIQRLTYNGKYNTGARISPDGKKVVFSRMVEGYHRIFLVDIATGKERQLTSGPGNDEEPCWSPDGFFLVFSSNRSGRYQLYLTNIHGDEPRLIATGDGEAMAPNWQIVTFSGGKKE